MVWSWGVPAASKVSYNKPYLAPQHIAQSMISCIEYQFIPTIKSAHLLIITDLIIPIRLSFCLPIICASLISSQSHHYNQLTQKGIELSQILLESARAPDSPHNQTNLDQVVRMCRLNDEWGTPWFHCPEDYHSSLPASCMTSHDFKRCFRRSLQHSTIRYTIQVKLFGLLIRPCKTLIFTTLESWWRSLAQYPIPLSPVFNSHVWGTLFNLNQTTHANAWHCSFYSQSFCDITAWFAAVRFRSVPPTLGVVTNTDGFGESWKLSRISVRSSLPISAYL